MATENTTSFWGTIRRRVGQAFDSSSWESLRVDTDNFMFEREDRVNANLSYFGRTKISPVNSTAMWQIRRVIKSGTNIETEYASLSKEFDKVWNSRTTYFSALSAFSDLVSVAFDGANDTLRESAQSAGLNILGTQPHTMSGWFKWSTIAGVRYLMGHNNSAANYQGYGIEWTGAALSVVIANSLSGANGIRVSTNAFTPVIGTWYHVCYTYDGSQTAAGVKIYVNNVLQAVTVNQDNLTLTIQNNGVYFAVGARNAANSFFAGTIGDVGLIYSQLDAAGVSVIYNAGKGYDWQSNAILWAFTACWWQMGDYSLDVFPNVICVKAGNVLTMQNGAAFVADAP
jgi:hypothetical protein